MTRRRVYIYVLATAVALLGFSYASRYNYLLFHSLAEAFSIGIGFTVFVVAWNSRRFFRGGYLLILGIAAAFVGALDLVHILSYKGMGVFLGRDANLPTQLWIAARYMQALSLLLASFYMSRTVRAGRVVLVYALVTTLLLIAIFAGFTPDCYIEGVGLTPFKIISEYVICLILLGAFVLLLRQRAAFDIKVLRWLQVSILATVVSELAFTSYINVSGPANVIGHVFKIIAFYALYRSILETGLRRPYALLFKELSDSEATLRSISDRLALLHDVDLAILSAQSTEEVADAVLVRLPAIMHCCVRASVLLFDLGNREMRIASIYPESTEQMGKGWHGPMLPEFDALLDSLAAGDVAGVEDVQALPPSSSVVRDLQAQGVRAQYYFPLQVHGQLLGSLNLGLDVPGAMHPDDVALVSSLAVHLSMALQQTILRDQVAQHVKGLEEELRRRTEPLIQSDKLALTRELVASLVHEIDNPLQSVIGCLELIGETLDDDEHNGELLSVAMDELERAAGLVSYLREFQRAADPLDLQPMNIGELVRRSVILSERRARTRDIQIIPDVDEELPPVMVAHGRMQQVFLNIIVNAIDAMPQGGLLQIAAAPTKAPAGVTLSFSDSGQGMSADTLDHLFDPFYTTKSDGVGLGLYVSQGIVREHRGQIEVESKVGEGATFRIWLPASCEVEARRQDFQVAGPFHTEE